jgi:hypothetical protein
MKLFITTAAAALISTSAMANDLFVEQSGNSNIIGSATNSVQQAGVRNTMTLVQSGPRNVIGGEDTWKLIRQKGDRNDTYINQSGRDNFVAWADARGDGNKIVIEQPGNDNRVSQLEVNGDNNDAYIKQDGHRNNGRATQVGDRNTLYVRQKGHENDFKIYSGNYGATTGWSSGSPLSASNRPEQCYSCEVSLKQFGDSNFAQLMQEGANQNATYIQSGNGNVAHSWQSSTRTQF